MRTLPPNQTNPTSSGPEVGPPPVCTPPFGTLETWPVVMPIDEPAVAVALALEPDPDPEPLFDPPRDPKLDPDAAGVTCERINTEQVTTLPPGLPVPLHWLTFTGIAGLTTDAESTVQCTVPPPPVPEPLHWVMVAPVVVAGNGAQLTVPPPPVADPTHWFTVAFVTGCAWLVPALTLFVTVTEHVIGWAESLSDPLHWLMLVTSEVEWLTNVPFPGAQGPSRQSLVRVVVDPRWAPSIVLTTTTVQTHRRRGPLRTGAVPVALRDRVSSRLRRTRPR